MDGSNHHGVDAERLARSAWQICYVSEAFFPGLLRLLPDGQIAGFADFRDLAWCVDDHGLRFVLPGGQVAIQFDPPLAGPEALSFEGEWLSGDRAGRRLYMREFLREGAEHALGDINPDATPGSLRANLAELVERYGWTIGDYSYGHPIIFEPYIARLSVGRFVSMAGNVCLVLGNHRMDTATTYPFAALQHIWPSAVTGMSHDTKGDIVIGNDVWIGAFAFIMAGVTVGDGAVIAGNTVVTKSVPPYAVVAGNPARIIRYRFPEHIIERLIRLAWWNWDARVIAARLHRIMSPDVEEFLDWCDTQS